ncbi:MAG: hypothetical protein RB292_00510 [Patescibacteria group bacterium]|jgi:hypothetical protein|nr:hypothetical protein [Patescibacteria group bacterium]
MKEPGKILPKSYRKIGLGFFVLSIIVTVAIGYLIWAKVIVVIHPSSERISQEMVFEIREGDSFGAMTGQKIVAGVVRSVEVEGSKNFDATGQKAVESNIVGEVTIINNYSKEQKLIASTRLADSQSPDQTLVRINKDVTVPPGGKIKVQVYPEDENNFSQINPARLMIPGLWEGLQDKIYAENEEPLRLGGNLVTVVSQEDLNRAQDELKQELFQQALSQVNGQLAANQALWPKLISSEIPQVTFDAGLDQEASQFTASLKVRAVVVVFDETQLIDEAREILVGTLSADKKLLSLEQKNFSYNVERYDLTAGTASIRAIIQGNTVLTKTSEVLDKSQIAGMTAEEVKSYFSQFSEIGSVEVIFHPAWLKKIPHLNDKIEIRISQ